MPMIVCKNFPLAIFPPICNLDCVHLLMRICSCDSRIYGLCNPTIEHNILKGYGQKANVDIEGVMNFKMDADQRV